MRNGDEVLSFKLAVFMGKEGYHYLILVDEREEDEIIE